MIGNTVSFPKRCWRVLLKKYYAIEHSIICNPKKAEKFENFCKSFPIVRKKVVVDSYHGKGYGDSAKYIVEELIKQHPNLTIIWLVDGSNYVFPNFVKPVILYSLRSYYESATAKVRIYNARDCRLTSKRNDQIDLQTWHGGTPTKRIEKDAEERLSDKYIHKAKEDGLVSNGIIAEGAYIEGVFRRAFWLSDQCEILPYGSPRADVFYDEHAKSLIKNKVFRFYGIDERSYVVLYAPTFRNSGSTDGYIENLEAVREAFSKRITNNIVLLVRLHPNVAKTSSNLNYHFSDNIINATYYDDQQELIVAADCGITDYSSMIFDFTLMKKPGFICMKDLEEFVSERGVYDLFYDLPFKRNRQEEELIEEIEQFDEKEYQKRLNHFYGKYPTYNKGDAAKKTAAWLSQKGLR